MINYLRDVRSELRHVSWPSRRLTVVYTLVVIGISLATAIYLGLLDFVFTTGVQQVI